MYLSKICILSLVSFLCFFTTSLWAQEEAKVKHELGLSAGFGISGETGIEYYNPSTLYTPNASMAFEFSYNALFLKEHLHLGIGVGYQTKSSTRIYNYEGQMDRIGPTSASYFQNAVILPVEIGYRLKIAPKHSLLADALVIPFWATYTNILQDPGDSPIMNYEYDGGINIDFGLQLGYQIQLTPRLSGQAILRSTISPFNSSTYNGLNNLSTEYYTLQLQLGIQYRLGAAL